MVNRSSTTEHRLTLRFVIKKGFEFTKKTFLAVFPLSILMSLLGYALAPHTMPTFAEVTDWIAFFLFVMGMLLLCALHAMVLLLTRSIILGQKWDYRSIIINGIHKSFAVLTVSLLYTAFIFSALVLFRYIDQYIDGAEYHTYIQAMTIFLIALPVTLLAVSFYLALFIVVLAEYKGPRSTLKRIYDSFKESILLIRGHWWKMLGLLVFIMLMITLIDQACLFLSKELVIFALLFCVLARSAILPFWYNCILAMLLELKARKVQRNGDLVKQKVAMSLLE